MPELPLQSLSAKLYVGLAISLFLATFGVFGVLILTFSLVFFALGFCYITYHRAKEKANELHGDFKDLLSSEKFSRGIPHLLINKDRRKELGQFSEVHSMSSSPAMDKVLEDILGFVMRDYVESWYHNLTEDRVFEQSLKRTTRRSLASLTHCMKQVDWVRFFTRDVVDDFASHLRLFRKASERSVFFQKNANVKGDCPEDLLSHFFDFELEMEKTLCRDLLSTTPHYENAYLHDLVDIVLYLIMPPEDFRCRPLRFLLREVIVKKVIVPTLDYLSDPNEIFQLLTWLLSEVEPRPEDFIACIENSESIEELDALYAAIAEEKLVMRGKDSGGEQDGFVKQQLASLQFVENAIKRKVALLSSGNKEKGLSLDSNGSMDNELVQLPIHVVLTNTIAVSYFIDFLKSVGGQNYIDCYLAIEGFKVSVEHQMRSLASGELLDRDAYETIKEAAQFMHQQYLSQEAITRVPLEDSLISKFLSKLKNDEPSDTWFEAIQEKIVDVLNTDDHFYPSFKLSTLYVKMLEELGIVDDERCDTPVSENGSVASGSSYNENSNSSVKSNPKSEEILNDGEPVINVVVETLGIGQQGKQSFALYNVRVSRSQNGKKVSGWNVLRRYSDFHTLHSVVMQKFPKLASLSFPGKKTFNNLDTHFLEKRTKALNQYMESILQPSLLRTNPELEKYAFDFLSQKEYSFREPLSKKVMSAMFDPIKSGMKAVGNTVMAVPAEVYGGVTKVGAGINNAAKTIINPLQNGPRLPSIETDRVAAALSDTEAENIPLRVLVLFVDEVFGVRARNAWFRRQMVMMLQQFVTPFGTSINKRIIDVVNWLTSEQQVTSYLSAFRDSMWPGGVLAPEYAPKPASFHHRCRVLAKTLMLSSMPDELRIVLGAETSYQGINTISEAFQNKSLNRRLLYVLLERLLTNVFPQNRFEKIFAQLHSKSPRTKKF